MPGWKPYERYEEQHSCSHVETRPTQYTKSNGVVCVVLQCVQCGERTRETSKSGYDVSKLPSFDEQFRDTKRAEGAAILKNLRLQWAEEFEEESQGQKSEWWTAYNDYLKSDHWRRVRRRALLRDEFRCQNCFCKLTDATAHAHHLSYDAYNRLGFSFAFEIIALCPDCHESFHGKTTDERSR